MQKMHGMDTLFQREMDTFPDRLDLGEGDRYQIMSKKCLKIEKFTQENCPEWIQEHPTWTSWTVGYQWIRKTFQQWFQNHSFGLWDNGTQKFDESSQLASRMITCLSEHWSTKGKTYPCESILELLPQETFSAVALQKDSEVSVIPRSFFELILTDALGHHQNKAYHVYEKRYRDPLVGVAYKFDTRNCCDREDTPDWWNDFYLYLTTSSFGCDSCRVEAFLGLSTLKTWLCQVLYRYLQQEKRKEQRRKKREGVLESDLPGKKKDESGSFLDKYPDERGDPLSDDIAREWLQYFTDSLKVAVQKLTTEERLRLQLRLYHSEKWIGDRVFQEKPHTTSRKYTQAMEHFQKEFESAMRSMLQNLELREWFEIIHPQICEKFNPKNIFFEEEDTHE